jgi:uncharacterized protein YqhQ
MRERIYNRSFSLIRMAENKKPFHYGGQAVIEGVMIRGQHNVSVAVRRPDGEIDITCNPLAMFYKGRLRSIPFIRGIIVLIETMVLGIQALLHSAQIASAEESGEQISAAALWGTAAISIAFGVGIFFVVPLLITNYFIYPFIASAALGNLLEGILRIGIFLLYLWAISFIPDIKTVFAYHGAEHKSVNAFESSVPLEPEQVQKYSTAHARCGTSFLLVVLVIAIIVFTLLGRPSLWVAIISRIVLLPVIAAIGYEFIRFGSDHMDNPVIRGLLSPGMLIQKMTTREPDEKQIETALCALQKAIDADNEDQIGPQEDEVISSSVNS